ncbi:hypothetical protein L2Y94_10480 [Luteibacter aegosomatis]|uniref:hypothetical protein n=1 Tax=Luteibacter aegosomatis TaxID=2911537 RepID=UPI001FFA0831|nr:hypothetical protein [Luteibacter aegosomatis]UPG87754.1 hypothetical protein L2Y94_10480 [Luteibacter aegosomatis]
MNELNGEAEVSAAGQITAVASSADALPGATFAACMGGGDCTGAEIAAAAAAMLPMEFELGIEANEIIAINKLHADGVVRADIHVETTIVNMAYREGKLARAVAAIRDIAGSHVFEDGNKRTAYDVAYKLLGGKIDPQKLRGVVADAAIHKINTAEEIEAALDR